MKRVYIVSGNYAEARNYVRQQVLNGQGGYKYVHLAHVNMIRGMVFGPEDVVYVGTYWQNPNFSEITSYLNYVHMMHKAQEKK